MTRCSKNLVNLYDLTASILFVSGSVCFCSALLLAVKKIHGLIKARFFSSPQVESPAKLLDLTAILAQFPSLRDTASYSLAIAIIAFLTATFLSESFKLFYGRDIDLELRS